MRSAPAFFLMALLAAGLAGCVDTDSPANQPLEDDDGRPLGREVRLVKVAQGLDEPVFVTGPGDGRLYVVEQPGRIMVVEGHRSESGFQPGRVRDEPFLDLRDQIRSGGEQGLLGLAFAPGWPEDPRVFVDYTDRAGDSVLSSFRADAAGTALDASSEVVLLRVEQPYSNHNGGMLTFGPDGMLYWSLGDGGGAGDPQRNGQDPTTLLGSILRLDVSADERYEVPADNPFVGTGEGRGEVWMFGLRNPWRFSFDGDAIWIGDVGQNRYEEVDRVSRDAQPGANLGWNAYEGAAVFDQIVADDLEADPVMPVATYARSGDHCAVTGGHVYGGNVERLRGLYVFADYCSGWVWALQKESGAEGGYAMGLLFESGRSVSSFGMDERSDLYLVDRAGDVLVFTQA